MTLSGLTLARVAVRGHGLSMIFVSTPGVHCFHRLFEWMATLMMLGVSACGLVQLSSHTPPQVALFILIGVLGTVRVSALYLNGAWPIAGPRARAICAVFGAVIWLQMMMVLQRHGGLLPIELPIYLCLTLGEIITCYRSAADVRRHL